MAYWLMKSEPEKYSIDDLKRDKKTEWSGVRNYQARNFMWKQMATGDQVLFYHSNAEPAGIVGLMEVCSAPHPDSTQFDKKSDYYDPKATLEKPLWFCVDLKFKQKFSRLLSLESLRSERSLSKLLILQKGSRLSVTPVEASDFKKILELAAQS